MIKNFLFHRVNPKRNRLWDPMDISLFDKCVRHISRKYKVCLLEELMENLEDKSSNKTKIATIVFDDGYKDNIEYALPILDKYNVKASFYIVTDCIEKNLPTWTHLLDHSFEETKKTDIILDFSFLNEELRIEKLETRGQRIGYVKKLKPAIKRLTHEHRMMVMERIAQSFNDVEIPKLMMNWDDLRQLKHAGHYIGSHTMTHAMLGTMTNEQDIRVELQGSGKIIQEKLGYFPLTISYPVGSYNDNVKRMSREAGYRFGLAVNQEPYRKGFHDLFEIPRMELYNESWFKTRLRIENYPGRIKGLWTKV